MNLRYIQMSIQRTHFLCTGHNSIKQELVAHGRDLLAKAEVCACEFIRVVVSQLQWS